jgi:hypothetical protein
MAGDNTSERPDRLVPDFPHQGQADRTEHVLLLAGVLACAVLIVRAFATAILFGGAIAIAAWPLRTWLVGIGINIPLSLTVLGVFGALLSLVSLICLSAQTYQRLYIRCSWHGVLP